MRLCVFKINHLQWMILPNHQDGPCFEVLGGGGDEAKITNKISTIIFAYGSPY